MLDFFLAIVFGVLVGCITGITPGLHMNLVASLLIALGIPGSLLILVFLVSLSVTHTFLDAIPAVFLGIPSADTVVALMPAHRLLLQGRGFDAVALLTFGSFIGLLFALFFSPFVYLLTPLLYELIRPFTFWVLLFIVLFLVIRDVFPFRAFVLFVCSAILGLFALRWFSVEEPLLPLLSGIFGVSSVISSIGSSSIPFQFSSRVSFSFFPFLKGSVLGFFSGFLPGVGSAQMASLVKSKSGEDFLMVTGALNTASLIFTIVFASVLGRGRSGTSEALLSLAVINSSLLLVLLLVVLISGCLAFFSCLLIAKCFALNVNRFRFSIIAFFVLLFVISLVFFVSGLPGLVVLFLSSSVGLLSIILGCSRSHAMACIIVPVMFYFW